MAKKLLTPVDLTAVPGGTAPLLLTSTTLVNNLNADLLDGQHGSYYADIPGRLGYTPVNLAGDTMTGDLFINKSAAIVGVGVGGIRNGGITNYGVAGVGEVGLFSEHVGGQIFLRPNGRSDVTGQVRISAGGNILMAGDDMRIHGATVDGADTSRISFSSADSLSNNRGAYLILHGNEHATTPGQAVITSGLNTNIRVIGAGSGDVLLESGTGAAKFNGNALVDATRTLTAGNGLTGGGTLAANRTFTLGTPGTLTGTSTNAVTTTSHTHALSANISSWDSYASSTYFTLVTGEGTSVKWHTSTGPAGGEFRITGTPTFYFTNNGVDLLTVSSTGNTTIAGNMTVAGNITSGGTATVDTGTIGDYQIDVSGVQKGGIFADATRIALYGASGSTLYLRPNGRAATSGMATLDASGNFSVPGTLSDSKGDVRDVIGVTRNSTTAFSAADAGKAIVKTTATARTWAVNTGVWYYGMTVTVINDNAAGNVTISQGTGMTLLNGNTTGNFILLPGESRTLYGLSTTRVKVL